MFRDSPHLSGQALARDLASCDLGSSKVLQYVDDLLLCSPTLQGSRQHTATLLNFLAQKGYRVSPDKAWLSSQQVTYLGLSLSPTSCSLTADRTQLLCNLQPPMMGDQILSFLGLVGFFRRWVPNFALLAKPLYEAAKDTPAGPLTSPKLVRKAFTVLRDTLLQAPSLSLPNPSRPSIYSQTRGRALQLESRPNRWAPHTAQ